MLISVNGRLCISITATKELNDEGVKWGFFSKKWAVAHLGSSMLHQKYLKTAEPKATICNQVESGTAAKIDKTQKII